MTIGLINLACMAMAGVATIFVLAGLLRMQNRLPVDLPNARSLHVNPLPRIGGLGILLGAGTTLSWCFLFRFAPEFHLVLGLGCAFGLAMLSLADDWFSLPVRWRLSGHIVAAVAVVWMMALPLALSCVLVLMLVWITNLFNFMDGADGLAGGMAIFGFTAYGLVAWSIAPGLSLTSLMLAAAAAGFLVFNFPPAKLFLGDAGSIPLGFLAGGLGLLGWEAGAWPIAFPFLVFSPFIADSTLTLCRRASKREILWQPHREHCYQRLIRMGWGHRRVALAYYALMAISFVSGLASAHQPEEQSLDFLLISMAVYLCLFVYVELKWLRYASTNPVNRSLS